MQFAYYVIISVFSARQLSEMSHSLELAFAGMAYSGVGVVPATTKAMGLCDSSLIPSVQYSNTL